MKDPIRTVQECAAEAEFQLLCAKDHMDWLLALLRAIQLAHTQGHAEIGAGLVSLAGYLSDSNFGHTNLAIREFAELSKAPPAPQNADVANRGAHEGGQL